MNTADRSVAQIDAALRRRFHFVPFFPDTPPIKDVLRRWLADKFADLVWIADIVDRANTQLINRHLAIGPSHFMIQNLDAEKAARAWEHSVVPYLEEQFFEDPERLAEFSWSRLRGQTTPPRPTAAPQVLVPPS
jgi:5-methylcytosine-specific restriction protein B